MISLVNKCIEKVIKMKKTLVINTSLQSEAGNSNQLANEFVSKLENQSPIQIDELDLAKIQLPHLTQEEMAAWMTADSARSEEQQKLASISNNLIEQLQSADTLVIGMPMYNFGVPSTFKAWIDRVARAGITFNYSENGPVGLLKDKKVVILAARGGMYAGTPKDSQSQYLKDVLAFIGLTDVEFIYAEGLNMANKDQSLADARQSMDDLLTAAY